MDLGGAAAAITLQRLRRKWLALPYADRERKDKLSKKFKVRGIPTLVILDTDGSVITTDGRSAVSEDPTGAAFPWKPKPLSELLGGGLVLRGVCLMRPSEIDYLFGDQGEVAALGLAPQAWAAFEERVAALPRPCPPNQRGALGPRRTRARRRGTCRRTRPRSARTAWDVDIASF